MLALYVYAKFSALKMNLNVKRSGKTMNIKGKIVFKNKDDKTPIIFIFIFFFIFTTLLALKKGKKGRDLMKDV